MSANVGSVDRILRFVIGVVALIFAFAYGPYAGGEWGMERILLTVVGVIMLGTAAIKFCPLYRILGVCTGR